MDNVNNPVHYGKGNIECIDYIEDFLTQEEYIGYLRGNIAKYLHRWRYKNKQEDEKDVLNSWMHSTGHRENILNEQFKQIGFGVSPKNNRLYWVTVFSN